MNALLACVLTISAVDVNVKTLAEQQVSGRLARVTAESVVITTDDGDTTFSTADLLSVTPKEVTREALAAKITVRLLDGSVLRSVSYIAADSTATIKLVGGGQVQLPTGAIHLSAGTPL
ncbi:MAG: hypothetical protein IH991_11625 [Planctomycetes bacterium]|nr:hypothetical protein [Planctomycetota bacterium]